MRRCVISILSIAFLTSSVLAQSLKTGKKYVTAIVDPGQGWVTVKLFPGRPQDGTLSYSKKSFITFKVLNKYYTNNDVGLAPFPANAKLLTTGVLKKTADTIRCTWADIDGFDLIQDVYPVLSEDGEQIVYKWKILNKSGSLTTASVQYLLDLQVGDQNYVNDGPTILAPRGYYSRWTSFSPSADSASWFFMAFQYGLPYNNTSNQQIISVGLSDNSIYDLHIEKPLKQIIGDWNQLIPNIWDPPVPLPAGTFIHDAGTLFQWSVKGSQPGKVVELGSMAYGIGGLRTCNGQLFSVLMMPQRIKWQQPNLVPNPFQISALVYNPLGDDINSAFISLTVGTDLKIKGPAPVSSDEKAQIQMVSGNSQLGLIPKSGVARATWDLEVQKETLCTSDILSTIKVFGTCPDVPIPVFLGPHTDTCEHTLTIECANTDFLPPIVDKFVYPDTFSAKIGIHDNRPGTDQGLQSIEWSFKNGTDSTKFDISYSPGILPCPTDNKLHTLKIIQKDSTVNGCIDLTFKDCIGNKRDTTVCFSAHHFNPDTLAPLVNPIDTLGKNVQKFILSDNTTFDWGIDSIAAEQRSTLDSFQISIVPALTPCSKSAHIVYVTRTDSLKGGCVFFKISDCAGNVTYDSVCFAWDSTLGVSREVPKGFSFDIITNPADKHTSLRITLAKASTISVTTSDALGREIRRAPHILPAGITKLPLDISDLAEGTYFVIVEITGERLVKSLKIVR